MKSDLRPARHAGRWIVAWPTVPFLVAALAVGAGAQRVAAPTMATLTPFSQQKAEQLLRDHLPCLGCHRLNGEGGTIGPDLTTVRARRSSAYIAAMIADPQGVVPGSAMPRTRMPASTRELIAQYLASQPGNAAASCAKSKCRRGWCIPISRSSTRPSSTKAT